MNRIPENILQDASLSAAIAVVREFCPFAGVLVIIVVVVCPSCHPIITLKFKRRCGRFARWVVLPIRLRRFGCYAFMCTLFAGEGKGSCIAISRGFTDVRVHHCGHCGTLRWCNCDRDGRCAFLAAPVCISSLQGFLCTVCCVVGDVWCMLCG